MIACKDGLCSVRGPITVDNVVTLLEQGREQLTSASATIDLSGVTEVDSSALSLLLEWRRDAARSGRAVRFDRLPANLQSLAQLYGVTELLSAE
jgi:phospholipid transport system transporter-binding protein